MTLFMLFPNATKKAEMTARMISSRVFPLLGSHALLKLFSRPKLFFWAVFMVIEFDLLSCSLINLL